LGKGREGDTDTLQKLGQDMNFSVTVVPPLVINGEVVSSTAVRKALADGNMEKVQELTGRPFSLQGIVITGAGRGVGLGFPTANLDISSEHALPPDGVYASWAYIDGKTYQSMANIGQCPTFGGCERTVEAYLVDYHGDLYGHELKIDVIARLRDEKKFNTVDDLQKQVAEDVRRGKAILNATGEQLGFHKGLWHYTIGQRKGLGLAAGERLYVVDIDVRRNALIVGPEEALYKDELKEWETRPDLDLHLTVDQADDGWQGEVGVVPNVIKEVTPSPENAYALVCGPPIMIKFTLPVLVKLGFPPERIVLSLEMKMKCGIGMCGRCNIGSKYICRDGPVFTLNQLNELPREY